MMPPVAVTGLVQSLHAHPTDTRLRSAPNHAQFAALAGGITLMRAHFTDHAFERHSHDCFALGVTTHGIQRFRCKGARHDSHPGDFVLFNPDEDHDGSRGGADSFRYTIWYVPADLVGSCFDRGAGVTGRPYFASPHATDPALARAFLRVSDSLLAAPSESLRAQALSRALLGRMLARHGERPRADIDPPRAVAPAQLLRVKDYIRAHFQRDVTIDELATVAGLSRAHLTRAFSAGFHVPPHVYLNAVRIGHAQTLMRSGMPLAQVAVECGYADQSHFSRRFKGSVGVAPAGWRAMQGHQK